MSTRTLMIIARKEVRDSLRNHWFILYSVAFGVLALGLASLSLAGTGDSAFAGFGRTTAGLVNLVLLVVPLMALTIGAASLAGERERGTLAYLLSMPMTRGEILIGKYLGLAIALLGSLAGGFSVSGAVIAAKGGAADAADYLILVAATFTLGLVMLSIGMLISAIVRSASIAVGICLFLWLGLAFLSDLGLMGSTIAFKLQIKELFHLAMVNPLQVFKMAVLHNIHATLDVLGPAGVYATQTYGKGLTVIFIVVLGAWVVMPLIAAYLFFTRRSEA